METCSSPAARKIRELKTQLQALKQKQACKYAKVERVEKKRRSTQQVGPVAKRRERKAVYDNSESLPVPVPAELRRRKPADESLTKTLSNDSEAIEWLVNKGFLPREPLCQTCNSRDVTMIPATADHFLGVLRHVEASEGLKWSSEVSLKGAVEVDGTSLGKFYVSKTCNRFAPQVAALTRKMQRAGKPLPKAFVVHFQVLGARERGQPPVLFVPEPSLTVPGSRPPTESLEAINQSGLLTLVSKPEATVIFSDGNVAWQSAAKKMRLKNAAVNHQNKQWTKHVPRHLGKARSVSRLAGTQCIDRSWLGLKTFIGNKVSRKSGRGQNACESNLVRQLVHQYMYRQSKGPCSPAEFLLHLGSSFRAMQD
ncbi:unnamed protein product [Symbiodinium sp. CCMP2592]|nr:unnamed protein product [Symbiodinium sp. CCMP2592]